MASSHHSAEAFQLLNKSKPSDGNRRRRDDSLLAYMAVYTEAMYAIVVLLGSGALEPVEGAQIMAALRNLQPPRAESLPQVGHSAATSNTVPRPDP